MPESFGFNTPFAEQLDFFRQKLNLPTERHDDIEREAHDRAFIVAGAKKADLLNDLHQELTKRMQDGRGLEAFRKDFRQIVQKHGWEGWTGSDTEAGVAWRTRVIYQTNMASSFAAGRWRQLHDPDLLATRPYWRYVHSDSAQHPRPRHKQWGDMKLTLRHDHPFWKTHFPPNGWGCGCRVTAVRGPEAGDATEPPADWQAIDPKTGTVVGIDKGWDYAPGANVRASLQELVDAKLIRLPPELARQMRADAAAWLPSLRPEDLSALIPDCDLLDGSDTAAHAQGAACLGPLPGQKTWKDWGRPDLRSVDAALRLPAPLILPAAATRSAAEEVMADALGFIGDAARIEIRTPVEIAIVRRELLPHLVEKEADMRERYAHFIRPTLENPFEVWQVAYGDGDRNRYIGLFQGDRDFMVVVRVNRDGSLLWNVMHAPAKKMNPHRLGKLLHGR